MFVTGDQGCVQIRRRTGLTVDSIVTPEDVNTIINRFNFEGSGTNILIGDRIELSTDDPRGLAFIDPSWWPDGTVHHSAMFYAHMNAMGGIRMYGSFEDAINNNKANVTPLVPFTGAPIAVRADVRDTGHHALGECGALRSIRIARRLIRRAWATCSPSSSARATSPVVARSTVSSRPAAGVCAAGSWR